MHIFTCSHWNCFAAYLFHMSADDSSQVRTAVLSCVSLNTKTLPEVLDRTRDVSESVRKVAYQVCKYSFTVFCG